MNNITEGWVIQRSDGKFLKGIRKYTDEEHYVKDVLSDITRRPTKDLIENIITNYELQNCKPVKVKIEVVADE